MKLASSASQRVREGWKCWSQLRSDIAISVQAISVQEPWCLDNDSGDTQRCEGAKINVLRGKTELSKAIQEPSRRPECRTESSGHEQKVIGQSRIMITCTGRRLSTSPCRSQASSSISSLRCHDMTCVAVSRLVATFDRRHVSCTAWSGQTACTALAVAELLCGRPSNSSWEHRSSGAATLSFLLM